jgi:hypothetical protein
MRTMAELESGSRKQSTSLKWPCVHRLMDGEVYEINMGENVRSKKWIAGDLEEMLELKRGGGKIGC